MQFFFSLPSRRLSYVKIVQGERNEKKKTRFLFSLLSRRLSYVKIVQGERNEKKKRFYNNIAFNDMYKLQFICLIGGRVTNPPPN